MGISLDPARGSATGPGAAAVGDGAEVVALVVQRRLAETSADAYLAWQRRVAARLASWPGFLDRQVIPPNPPVQVDWVVVQRFRDLASARGWLQSPDRAALAAEIADHFLGNDEIQLRSAEPVRPPSDTTGRHGRRTGDGGAGSSGDVLVTENTRDRANAASALISARVAPDLEGEFLAWQRSIAAAESRFDGFVGHKVERPIPGVQEDWVVLLSFDSDEHLDGWLASPERAALLADGERFTRGLRLVRSSYGFGFWSGDPPTAAPDPVFKSNLLVLLMLYPVVFLWGYFVADPLFASHDVPFWLSLFIGNVVSTQLLGWWLVPWAFRRFRWWLRPGPARAQMAGYLLIGALYAGSMAVYAVLLALRS